MFATSVMKKIFASGPAAVQVVDLEDHATVLVSLTADLQGFQCLFCCSVGHVQGKNGERRPKQTQSNQLQTDFGGEQKRGPPLRQQSDAFSQAPPAALRSS